MKKYSFGKNRRLVKNEQFLSALSAKLRARNELLILYMKENNRGQPRLGISIGKSSGNAVTRNKLKRLLREIFRQNQYNLHEEYDYLVMMGPILKSSNKTKNERNTQRFELENITFKQINNAFLELIEQIKQKIS